MSAMTSKVSISTIANALTLAAAVIAVTAAGRADSPFSQKLSKDKQVIQALNRMTFGPRPGDAAQVRKMGLTKWIEQQLHPDTIAESPVLQEKLSPLVTLAAPTWDLMTKYPIGNAILNMRLPSAIAMSSLSPQQQSRIQNGSLEERKATLASLDAPTRRLVMVAAPPRALDGLPEEWIQEANDTRKAEQEERQKELRRLQPPLMDLVTPEQLRTINRGTVEEKIALVNGFDPEKRRLLLRVFPPAALNDMPALRREAMSIRDPQQFVNSELVAQKLYRAIYSNRQLEEVLVDFWMNHFNVFNGKGQARVLLTSYERDAIRPYIFGHFKDMLLATARHPAMLYYLDNWQSQVPRDDLPPLPPGAPRRPGLNENYGREILELHTLGVNGGYTQDDVVNVARAFSGWTIYDQQKLNEFQFNPAVHDRKEKIVLGHVIPAMGGEQDGLQVIDILAHHPSTARFISKKLAQRFVADDPPQTLIDKMAATFTRTDGDLRAVLETLFNSPEFFSEGAFRSKVKSPLEMVVSAVRATNADVNDTFVLAQRIADLGEPLYGKLEPTGYPNTGDAWTNTASILGRINFSNALANGAIQGVKVNFDRFKAQTPERVAADLLEIAPPPTMVAALEKGLEGKPKAPVALLPLILGSPDFQRR